MGASILQVPAIKKAKELGHKVIAVDMNPNAIGFCEKEIVKEVVSTLDLPGVLKIAKKHKIDGIMTIASDKPVKTVAYVGEKLGLNTVTVQTAMKATNKTIMRDCLKTANVPIPKYFKVNDMEQYLNIIKKFSTKCIIKPADNSGSRGIYLINNVKNTEEVIEAYNYSMKNSSNGYILVEEFMEGNEVSVECICINGKCNVIQITDKLTTGNPFFVEMGHNEPSMFDSKIQEQIKNVAVKAVKAIDIINGAAHVEIMVTKDGPKIVELGARLGGDNITTHLVPLSTGVDMVECCIKIALNEVPDITKKYNKGAAIRFFDSKEGRVEGIYGLEDAKKIKGVKQISLVHNVGEKVNEIHSSTDRIGFIITQGDTAEKAIEYCDAALEKIKIKINKDT